MPGARVNRRRPGDWAFLAPASNVYPRINDAELATLATAGVTPLPWGHSEPEFVIVIAVFTGPKKQDLDKVKMWLYVMGPGVLGWVDARGATLVSK